MDPVWWKNLSSISVYDGLGVGTWFLDNLGCIFYDGSTTLFWWDPWLNESALKDRFIRLFDLDENKLATIL